MRFRRNAPLDPGQVTDLRGRRLGGPGGAGDRRRRPRARRAHHLPADLACSRPAAAGSANSRRSTSRRSARAATPADRRPSDISTCRTGEDANAARGLPHRRRRQQRAEVLGRRLRQQQPAVPVRRHGLLHRPGADRLRRRRLAGRAVLLPEDKLVYIDLGFFDELRSRFGVERHAVRRGVRDRARVRTSRAGPARRARPDPRRYAGAREQGRALRAAGGLLRRRLGRTRRRDGPRSTSSRRRDINSGLDAAAAIGDDRIQEETQGQVNPETWTHGSSEQRRRWFSRGYETGKPAACNTFTGSI